MADNENQNMYSISIPASNDLEDPQAHALCTAAGAIVAGTPRNIEQVRAHWRENKRIKLIHQIRDLGTTNLDDMFESDMRCHAAMSEGVPVLFGGSTGRPLWVTQIQQSMATLTTKVTANQDALSTLTTKVTANQDALATLTPKVTALTNGVATLQQTVEQMRDDRLIDQAMISNVRRRDLMRRGHWTPIVVERTGINPVGDVPNIFPASERAWSGMTGRQIDDLEHAYNLQPGSFGGVTVADRRLQVRRYFHEGF